MRAMVLHEWGGPLTLESVPDPSPAHGEVVLRVHACAPDQFDVTIRAGRAGGKIPLVLGDGARDVGTARKSLTL